MIHPVLREDGRGGDAAADHEGRRDMNGDPPKELVLRHR
jgi:hypothetical protein